MMIKSKVKGKEVFEIDFTNCPNCKESLHLNCLISYNGSGYTPADQAKRCPFCGFLATLKDWKRWSN